MYRTLYVRAGYGSDGISSVSPFVSSCPRANRFVDVNTAWDRHVQKKGRVVVPTIRPFSYPSHGHMGEDLFRDNIKSCTFNRFGVRILRYSKGYSLSFSSMEQMGSQIPLDVNYELNNKKQNLCSRSTFAQNTVPARTIHRHHENHVSTATCHNLHRHDHEHGT